MERLLTCDQGSINVSFPGKEEIDIGCIGVKGLWVFFFFFPPKLSTMIYNQKKKVIIQIRRKRNSHDFVRFEPG